MYIVDIAWYGMILGALVCIWYSYYITTEGLVRQSKKVVLKSKIIKGLLCFPVWIVESDVSIIITNIINEMLTVVLIVGLVVLDDSEKKYIFDKYAFINILIFFGYLIWSAVLETLVIKERKEKPYFRETVDIGERKGEIIFGDQQQYKYEYVYAYSKRVEQPSKVIVFLPESYHMNQDVDGNVYFYSKKAGYQKNSNIGAYEELADCFVRAGNATLRCARKLEVDNAQADGTGIGLFLQLALQQVGFAGEVLVLAHGPNHRRLKAVCDTLKPVGIISLCGAGLGIWEELIHKEVWQGKNPQRVQEKYRKKRDRAIVSTPSDTEVAYILQMTQEQWIQEFVGMAEKMPIFLGYVECDPYYDEQIVEEIRKSGVENITIYKFEDTDFTLRAKNKNRKNGVLVNGHTIEPRMSRLNPLVAERIQMWVKEH